MAKQVAKKATKKRVKKNVGHGQAHIQSSFNNTIVTINSFNVRLQPGSISFTNATISDKLIFSLLKIL